MKNIIKILFVFLLTFSFTNCEKESEGLTRITYYAEIAIVDGTVLMPIGGTYVEPGFSGNENGVDKTADIVVTNNIDAAKGGVYYVTYTLYNSDGYPTIVNRLVIVSAVDPDAPASGIYNASIVRTEADGSDPRPRGPFELVFVNEGSNVYSVSCLLGGYYSIGSGYGDAYAAVGRIEIDKVTNTFSLLESSVAGWGDELAGFQNSTYDPGTGVVYWESIYAGGDTFAVTLSK